MPFFWWFGLLIFALGAAVGSFLNVLVYRSVRGTDWVRGRSVCEHCGRPIAWYENIPILSYLFLRGECAHCHKKIDPIHPLMELLTGSLFLWWYAAGTFLFHLSSAPLQIIQPLFWLWVGVMGMVIFISDIRSMVIPTWAVAGLTVGTLVYRFVLVSAGAMQPGDFWISMGVAVAFTSFFLLLWASTRGKGFGFGDVLLAFPLGLLLGSWQRMAVAVLVSFISGAVVGLGLVAARKKKLKHAVPFGPFLLGGSAMALVWGYDLWAWYVRILGG